MIFALHDKVRLKEILLCSAELGLKFRQWAAVPEFHFPLDWRTLENSQSGRPLKFQRVH